MGLQTALRMVLGVRERGPRVSVNKSGLGFGWHMKEGDRKLMLPG